MAAPVFAFRTLPSMAPGFGFAVTTALGADSTEF
jgi:hypothetical protein